MSIDLKKISGCGVLPIAIIGGRGSQRGRQRGRKLMFLLSREQEFKGWKGSGKYADFGGAIEKGENVLDCAAREGYEESMGFMGSLEEMRKKVTPTDKDFVDAFTVPNENNHMMFVVKMYYNKYLPKMFRDVFEYITKCGTKIPEGKIVVAGCPEGFIEKDELRWVSFDELKRMVERKDDSLRTYFSRCLEIMFSKYPDENSMLAKIGI